MVGSSSSQEDIAGSSNIEIVSKSNRTAPIWKHFDLVRKDCVLYARCHRCGKLMTSRGNSSLSRHWNSATYLSRLHGLLKTLQSFSEKFVGFRASIASLKAESHGFC
ncbi:hypothetical protein L6452_20031 [Arctium lappa]|uniref:Uncharacterized protein n=1 Tax=Arctium lappa TaxID=4217 RepID=A0ACB9B9H2_ARCLA|nr:hypothetical protein L6452_20031 [Arctium lappa]